MHDIGESCHTIQFGKFLFKNEDQMEKVGHESLSEALSSSTKKNKNEEKPKKDNDWIVLAKVLDRLCFITVLSALLLSGMFSLLPHVLSHYTYMHVHH